VEAYDYGVDDDGPCYTMELLDGGELAALAPLPWKRVVQVYLIAPRERRRDSPLSAQAASARAASSRFQCPRPRVQVHPFESLIRGLLLRPGGGATTRAHR
jgi:hypothetical protein